LYFLNELFLEKFESFMNFFYKILSYQMVKLYENTLFLFILEKQFSAIRQTNFFLRTSMDLKILAEFKTLNEKFFFQNLQTLSPRKKKLSVFHLLNLSLHKFKINNFFPNWMQISICQLQTFFCLFFEQVKTFHYIQVKKQEKCHTRISY